VGWAFREYKYPLPVAASSTRRNVNGTISRVLNYIYGFALVAAFIGVWLVGWYVFTWLLYGFLSLFPYMGKRHRHARWDELNGIKRQP
jgi:hypothetical protein